MMRPVPLMAWIFIAVLSIAFLITYTPWYQRRIANHPFMKAYRILMFGLMIVLFTVWMLNVYDVLD